MSRKTHAGTDPKKLLSMKNDSIITEIQLLFSTVHQLCIRQLDGETQGGLDIKLLSVYIILLKDGIPELDNCNESASRFSRFLDVEERIDFSNKIVSDV